MKARYTVKALYSDIRAINNILLAEQQSHGLAIGETYGCTQLILVRVADKAHIRQLESGSPRECLVAANRHMRERTLPVKAVENAS